jgi:hypothetical protein
MVMKTQCIQAVNQAAGRVLSAAELQGIDDRLNATMRRLAASGPNWQAKSTAQRVEEAAVAALADIQREAARKVANVQRQAVATAQIQVRIQTLSDAYQGGQTRGLVEEINNTSHYADAVKRESVSNLVDLVEATSSGEGASMGRRVAMFLFGVENHAMTKDLVSEIFAKGQAGTGNALAKSGAQAWLKVIENLRERFNAAGGDVGRLDYGYIPMAHDAARIRDAGRGLLNRAPTLAEAKDVWTAGVLPKLDRRRYVREDGSRMSDADVTDFLRAAFDTLVSDGMNKQTPGAFKGTGARANRGSESRLIHFKDGEAYLAYNREFGSGSMYDAMTSHIGAMARDIALVERWGPNPNQQYRLQSDLAMMADGGIKRIGWVKPQAYWDIVSGVTGSPDSARIAAVGMHSRNIQTMGKLAGAVISSITDLASIMVTANYNKLPYFDLLRNTKMMATKEGREFATAHGVIAESMINDMNRFQAEHIANNWSGRLANSTMRLSLMNAWTDTLRRGFSVTMQQGLGRISKKAWADLTEWDRFHLTRKGITEDDWAVVNQAQLTHYKGADYLTPEAIAAAGDTGQVSAKILGLITDESEYAVINPDLTTKAWSTGGLQAGTVKGELALSVMQFKSFPIAMISRHWRRMLETPQGLEGAPVLANKAAYTAAMLITTTLLGAVAFQVKQMLTGKDPVDMTTPKFWTRAAAQGGGAGFVGDMILGDTTQDRSTMDTLGRMFLGPTFGSAADLYALTKGNIDEKMAGKDTHAAAEAIKFTRSHLPYVNLWYGKAALDHMIMHGVQENLSPGYLARQKQRAYKDWKQGFWWEPGEALPDRAPQFGGR